MYQFQSSSDHNFELLNFGYLTLPQMLEEMMVSSATELVAEVKLDNAGMAQLSELRNLPGVKEISVMSSTADSVL